MENITHLFAVFAWILGAVVALGGVGIFLWFRFQSSGRERGI